VIGARLAADWRRLILKTPFATSMLIADQIGRSSPCLLCTHLYTLAPARTAIPCNGVGLNDIVGNHYLFLVICRLYSYLRIEMSPLRRFS